MRRIIYRILLIVIVINAIGIILSYVNFLNLQKEIKKTLLINKSLLSRTEVLEKSLTLLNKLNKGNVDDAKGLVSGINTRLSECYACHHKEETITRLTAGKEIFERALRYLNEGKKINSGDIAVFVKGFVTYSFEKAKDLSSTQTQILEAHLLEAKRYIAFTIGFTILAFLFFSYYAGRKGASLEKEIKEKEKVITDWALEWQNTFDAMQDMVIVLDENYKPLIFNTAAADFFGVHLLKADFLKMLGIKDIKNLNELMSRTIQFQDRTLSLRVYPISDDIKKVIIVLRDITREMELEEKLKRAEKLASLGIMAGGIAHEVNNPLSPIIGYSEVLYNDEEDEKKREYLRTIIFAAQRIEKIVKDLLSFAREQTLKIAGINIEEVIDNVIKTLEGMKSLSGIKIIKDINYSGPVNIDKGLFEIAFLNLLKNAVQTIEDSKKGDSIRISSLKENGTCQDRSF
ncbi:MAG: two-component system sensor histidine kinase NtrB [Thermodesulfovibrionales bacterium]